MTRILQSFFMYGLTLGLVACSGGPRVVAGGDAGVKELTDKDVAILNAVDHNELYGSRESGGFALGAGDVLGQHVFTHAVALARAEHPEVGWRYADASGVSGGPNAFGGIGNDRAIYPAFLGVAPTGGTAFDNFETVWIWTSGLRGRDRATSVLDPQGAGPIKAVPSVIVLVPVD